MLFSECGCNGIGTSDPACDGFGICAKCTSPKYTGPKCDKCKLGYYGPRCDGILLKYFERGREHLLSFSVKLIQKQIF